MNIGDRVKVVDAKGLGKYGFRKGDLCAVNSLANVDGKDLAMVMPDGSFKFYWVEANRLEVVEDEEIAPTDSRSD